MNSLRKSLAKGLVLAGLALTLPFASWAQSKPALTQAPKRCLMWKAVNGNNVVYLLGSIHIGSKDMYPLPKIVESSYESAKTLVVEVDITKPDQTAMLDYVVGKGSYKGDDVLWSHLSNKTAEKVRKACEKYSFPEAAAEKMKPWLLAIELSVLPMMKAGMDMSLGIDQHFLTLAHGKTAPKKIEEIETADFQLKTLSSLPDSLSDSWLNYTIGEADQAKDEDVKIAKLWKQGDADALAKSMLEFPSKEIAKFQRTLLEDRNPHMAQVAEKYLKGEGQCFFVVGAAHLVGPEGVVAILKKRGYSVTQVSAAESAAN